MSITTVNEFMKVSIFMSADSKHVNSVELSETNPLFIVWLAFQHFLHFGYYIPS